MHLERNYQVDEHEWDLTVERWGEVEKVPKGEYFVSEGKVCRNLGFIAEGLMRYARFEENGDETTCYFVSEEDFTGDPISFDTQKPSTMNIQAVTDCVLVTLSFEAKQQLSKNVPRFNEIMAAIGRKTMMDLLAQKDFLLNRDASARYQYFMEHYSHILRRAPLGYIASYLGMTQQSLSRLRKQLL
jgi:CRP-like cAMP-binding protein